MPVGQIIPRSFYLHSRDPFGRQQIPQHLKVEVEKGESAQQAVAAPHLSVEKASPGASEEKG